MKSSIDELFFKMQYWKWTVDWILYIYSEAGDKFGKFCYKSEKKDSKQIK